MEKEPSSGIHAANYESQYLEKRVRAASLLNIAGREGLESLNGAWNFAADWYDSCRRNRWFADTDAPAALPKPKDWDWDVLETMPVPSCWNIQRAELFYYEGHGVYTRTFRYVPHAEGERVFLRFEGAAYQATVFLNGRCVGLHDGASTPFNIEVTDALASDNRIIVCVDARRSPARVPMDNTDWFNYGGLYRDVFLVRVPKVFIKDYFIRLVPDGTFGKIAVDVELDGSGEVLFEVPELGLCERISVPEGCQTGTLQVNAKPELWCPENPKLYECHLSCGADRVTEPIGFREIRVRGQEVLLNGKRIFLKGVSVHEDHPDLGKTTKPDIIRQTLRDLKDLQGCYLRLAHYPHDARFARIADEQGVLLWEEVPVYWAIAFDAPATYADAENQLAELVLRDRNRASVIIWSVGNENRDTDSRFAFMSALVQKARELDSTRLVSAACWFNTAKSTIDDRLGEVLDVIGINEYYGWYDPAFEKLPKILANAKPNKPIIISEFGGGARAGHHGTSEDLFTEEHQAQLYEKQLEAFKQAPYIAGSSPWILYDFRCPRRFNRYQEGYNRKGLIDANHTTRKLAFDVLRNFSF
jgi:beta-glucuronidase